MKSSEREINFKRIARRAEKLIPACEKIAIEEGELAERHTTSSTTSVTYISDIKNLKVEYYSGGWGNETRTIQLGGETVFYSDNYARGNDYPICKIGSDTHGITIYKPGDWEKLVLGSKDRRDKIRGTGRYAEKPPQTPKDPEIPTKELADLRARYKGIF